MPTLRLYLIGLGMGIFLSLLYVLYHHWGIIKFWWSGATLDQVFKDALGV